jgi:putative ABC transport system substrate-binding protein
VGLPAIAHNAWFTARYGGLLSYGVAGRANVICGRGAHYIDQVLRGRPLAEMPVEEVYEAGLVVNLDAAQRLGVTLSPTLIARANRLIHPGERTPPPIAGTETTR